MSNPIGHIESLVNQGRYLEACQLAKGELKSSADLRLKQLYALALSKSGTPELARDFLEPIYKDGAQDPETAGILGSIYKELFRKNQSSSFATLSRDTYLANYRATGNYYTGINAASMSAMLMQSSTCKEIARQIIDQLKDRQQTFWEMVTLAEAFLILKERQQAIDTYASARKIAGTDWGPVMSVHRQLWLLNHYIPVPKELFDMFAPSRVAAFIGHMIDHPSRPEPRFTPSMEADVALAIKQNIERLKIQVGFSALACGSDILFAEAMAEVGGTVHILLPFDVDDFTAQSVRFAGDHWVERFQTLMRKFPVTFVTKEAYRGEDGLFSLQGKIILGSAILQSTSFQSEPVLLTVLAATDTAIKEGGTRHMINNWPYPRTHVNIGLESFARGGRPAVVDSRPRTIKEIVDERPVQFLVRIDGRALTPIDQKKLSDTITAAHGPNASFVQTADGTASWILSFDYETAAINMIKTLAGLKYVRQISLALHAGPVDKTKGWEEGEVIEELKCLATYVLPGATYATHNFAALLALLPGDFEVEYSSTLVIQGEEIRVYRIVCRRK